MKKIFLVFATAAIFAACNNNPKPGVETNKEIVTDTVVQYKNSVNTDTAKTAPVPLAEPLPAKTEVRREVRKEKVTRTGTTATVHTNPGPVTATHSPVGTTTSTNSTTTSNTGSGTTTSSTDNTKTTTSATTPAVTPEKKGMSNSTKGAIIGGGVGAIGGAIISKKKGKGAIIGGILGAGAGYIFGKKKDKKDTAR